MSELRGKTIFCFLIFSFLSCTYATETIESRVINHEIFLGDSILLEWVVEGLNDSDVLRIYELPCIINDSGIKCPYIKSRYRIKELNITELTGIESIKPTHTGIVRVCADLLHGGKDCDKNNYALIKEIKTETKTEVITEIKEIEKIIEKTKYVVPEPSFLIQIIKWPEFVRAGENITMLINITNPCNFSQKVEVYSYLFNSSHCYTGGWTKNKKQILLAPFTSALVNLTNNVNNSANGRATLRIRAKVNGTNYDSSRNYTILKRLYSNLSIVEKHNFTKKFTNLTIIFNNTGNIPSNITVAFLFENKTLFYNYSVSNYLIKNYFFNSSEFVLNVLEEDKLIYSKFIAKPKVLLKNKITGGFLIIKQKTSSFSNVLITKQNVLYVFTSLFSLGGLYFLTKKY